MDSFTSTLTDDTRQMLCDSAGRFIAQDYTFASRLKWVSSDEGYSSTNYQTFAELGWLGVAIPEEFEGFGGQLSDMAELAEHFGKGLVTEPWFATLALAAPLLLSCKNHDLQQKLLPGISTGSARYAVAWETPNGGSNPQLPPFTAVSSANEFILSGLSTMVLSGNAAHGFLLSAHIKSSDKIALFYVPKNTQGLTYNPYTLVDGNRAGELKLDQAHIPSSYLVSEDAGELLKQTINNAKTLSCFEALGCMQKLLDCCVDYTQTRKQFNAPIAQFQALRHMLADMLIQLKKTRCLAYQCLANWRANGSVDTTLAGRLKVQTGKAGHFIGRQAIQIHGGVGMTDELEVGHYVKRLCVIDGLFGNSRYHLAQLASSIDIT